MTAPKEEAKKVISSLPEDVTYEEILRELAFNSMGLNDADHNRTVSNEKMKQMIK